MGGRVARSQAAMRVLDRHARGEGRRLHWARIICWRRRGPRPIQSVEASLSTNQRSSNGRERFSSPQYCEEAQPPAAQDHELYARAAQPPGARRRRRAAVSADPDVQSPGSARTSRTGRRAKQELPDEQKKELREAFELFDTDKVGSIDYHELKVLMRALGFQVTKREVLDLVEDVDVQRSGHVDFNDYMEISKALEMKKRRLWVL